MPTPYAIIAITERPIYYHEHITTPDVNVSTKTCCKPTTDPLKMNSRG